MGYEAALTLARDEFRKCDPVEVCRRTRSVYDPSLGRIFVGSLGGRIEVTFPGGDVCLTLPGVERPVLGPDRVDLTVLTLHYLTSSSGAELFGRWVAFRELPGGSVYDAAFQARVVSALVRTFGGASRSLLTLAGLMDGQVVSMGTAAVTLSLFPLLPLTLVVWQGDDEFQATGTVLYDASAPLRLVTEDLVAAPSVVLSAARRVLGANGGPHCVGR